MDDGVLAGAPGSEPSRSLRARVPAENAIAQFLSVQERSAPRSLLARVFGAPVLSDESRRRYFEVVGELAVADALDRLDTGWVVLHAIEVESRESAIDHVVIGPGGVFTLSSNYHGRQSISVADRRFHVAGTRVNHIRDTEFDIGRVERRLSAAAGQPIHVVGVIVVVDPRTLTVRDVPKDIAVVRADELADWLRARPPVLSPECVSTVAGVAERPSTWVPGGTYIPPGDDLTARFEAVRREVRTATVAHRLWLVVVCVGLVGIFAVAAWGVLLETAAG